MGDAHAANLALQQSVWNAMCHHIDGIAIGSTVHALAHHGVFRSLGEAQSPLSVTRLAERVGARTGFFHVAIRLLAHQGLVRLGGDPTAGEVEVSLTDQGRQWLPFVDYYHQAPRLIDTALGLSTLFRGGNRLAAQPLDLPDLPRFREHSAMASRVALHLQGVLVASVMKELASRDLGDCSDSRIGEILSFANRGTRPSLVAFVAKVLESQGWIQRREDGLVLTPAGSVAATFSPQYYYPVSYLSTFRAVPSVLFGKGHERIVAGSHAQERHVDRDLDVRFSGLVFDRTCKRPFLDVVLPLFNRDPVGDQPACVVDTGSGDGTLLVALYRAIRERTLRGRMLHRYPLLMVGAEYHEVAMRATHTSLQCAGVPHLDLFGDIGDPSGIARKLADRGIDPLDALHVSKSVIHNRRYRSPQNRDLVQSLEPMSRAAFVSPDGQRILARELECSLVELFWDWIPHTRRHGIVVIEAHTVDPHVAAQHVGRTIVTCLDATHGYSSQYLVESEVFDRAAEIAGFRTTVRRELGGQVLGRPLMTIHHLVPA